MENKNMKTKFTMIALLAVIALFAVSFTSANLANSVTTEFNNVMLGSGVEMVGSVDKTVPVRVTFVAAENASDVKIKASIEGLRDDILESTNRFDIVVGKTYTKLLNLDLPGEDQDLTEDYTLYVQIVNTNDKTEIEYDITMQRESYTLSVLSVDYNTRVSEEDVFPVSVVVKNTGFNRADDVYVIASIPALDISTRGYVGDIIPVESFDDDDDDEEDSMQKTVYLQIPAEATSGVYDLVVEVYNDDAEVKTSSLISITGSAVVDENDAEDSDAKSVSTSIIALTVVLVIIFVVLLAVLVVLVTRKDKEIEEAETSYY